MNNHKVMSQLSPKSHVAEAFRILRTNLQFLIAEERFKSLLVTSPGPSEGKSTNVANLAVVMAQSEVKVILLDADLRRAELHHLFDLPNDAGLTNVLVGSMEISEVLQKTKLPNLRVITSGPLPPNPAELIDSEKTKEVIANLADMADIVLIDAPPVLAVADAAILSSIVDGCILVVKSAKTKTEDIKHAKERLDKANARIVGTVLNAIDRSNGKYSYDAYYGNTMKEISAGKL